MFGNLFGLTKIGKNERIASFDVLKKWRRHNLEYMENLIIMKMLIKYVLAFDLACLYNLKELNICNNEIEFFIGKYCQHI
jgi:hypothetical protein